jgi:hypothetical protein
MPPVSVTMHAEKLAAAADVAADEAEVVVVDAGPDDAGVDFEPQPAAASATIAAPAAILVVVVVRSTVSPSRDSLCGQR